MAIHCNKPFGYIFTQVICYFDKSDYVDDGIPIKTSNSLYRVKLENIQKHCFNVHTELMQVKTGAYRPFHQGMD